MLVPAPAPTSRCSIPTNARRARCARSRAHPSRSSHVSPNQVSSAPLASQCRTLRDHCLPRPIPNLLGAFLIRTAKSEPMAPYRGSTAEIDSRKSVCLTAPVRFRGRQIVLARDTISHAWLCCAARAGGFLFESITRQTDRRFGTGCRALLLGELTHPHSGAHRGAPPATGFRAPWTTWSGSPQRHCSYSSSSGW